MMLHREELTLLPSFEVWSKPRMSLSQPPFYTMLEALAGAVRQEKQWASKFKASRQSIHVCRLNGLCKERPRHFIKRNVKTNEFSEVIGYKRSP